MFSNFSILVATVVAAAAAVSAAGPTINTPASLTQCQPVLLTWTGSQGKTYVKVLPANEPSATPLVSFQPQDAGSDSIKWVPNLPANTQVSFAISDDTGEQNYSAPATVRAGTDTQCLNSSGSAAADGSTATTGSSGSSGSSSSGSSSSPGSSSSSGSAPSSSSSKAPAASGTSSSNQSSGATSNAASMVGTGLAVAAAAVAYFA